MPAHDLFVIYLIALLLVLLPSFGLYKLFPKAGIPAWKAFVPFYNTWLMQEAAHRPKYWAVLQLVPVAGWFITMGIFIEWVKLFGKFSLGAHTMSALLPMIYFPYIASHKDTRYIGPDAVKKNYKKSGTREWVDAGVFAVVAATLIRTFVFEAYTIPTSSMEKTLLVNDFLFVSKLSYGPRIPNTPLAMPFVHHTLPFTHSKSYVEWIKIPYTRWFASPVKRNDVVVFNVPAGDTVINKDGYQSETPYYDVILSADGSTAANRQAIFNDPENYPLVVRPVDKRENYIKRCVAISGDTIQLKQGILYVNGELAYVSPTSATFYTITTANNKVLSEEEMRDAGVKLNQEDNTPDFVPAGNYTYRANLTLDEAEKVKKITGVVTVSKDIDSIPNILVYPRQKSVAQWSADYFGPLWIPKKDATIQLTRENIAFYRRAIEVYENNKWEEKDGKIFINDQPATTYTFKMNYFWMMGDNRHKSQDSRYWGFVPEDHVVGEAWLIWMSWEHGVRWSRLFRRIH
jgi:signal peptidase I